MDISAGTQKPQTFVCGFCAYLALPISAAFLGIVMKRSNILRLLGFSCATGLLYLGVFLTLGEAMTRELYPLIVHLPLILLLVLYYKYRPLVAAISVLTAYLCCQISNWVGIAFLTLTHEQWCYYAIRIVVTVMVFLFLLLHVSDCLLYTSPSPRD